MNTISNSSYASLLRDDEKLTILQQLQKDTEAAKSIVVNSSKPTSGMQISVKPTVEMIEKYKKEKFAKELKSTMSNGSTISVKRIADTKNEAGAIDGFIYKATIESKSGTKIELEFNQDVKMGYNGENQLVVFFADSNTSRVYNPDGSFEEVEGYQIINRDKETGHILPEKPELVTIGVTGKDIHSGDAMSNIIMVYADETKVYGGIGNDTIMLADEINDVSVNSGEGNDTVTGKTATKLDLVLGTGSNTVLMDSIIGGSIKTSDRKKLDNNKLVAELLHDVKVAFGNGDNNARIDAFTGKALLTTGEGNNEIFIRSLGARNEVLQAASNGQVLLGNGKNHVTVYDMLEDSLLSMGNGNNKATVFNAEGSSSINAGKGNNTIAVNKMTGSSSLSLGDGNNSVQLYELLEDASANIGNGNNEVDVYSLNQNSKFTVGDGNNTVSINFLNDTAKANFGNGYNTIDVMLMKDAASLILGDGDNALQISKMQNDANATAGNGNNTIYEGKKEDATQLTLGSGDNTLIKASEDTSILKKEGTDSFATLKIRKNILNAVEDYEKKIAELENQRASYTERYRKALGSVGQRTYQVKVN